MNVVPVILAGGIGERFWPLSRAANPKQLLQLVSNRTMAEETLARVDKFTSRKVNPLFITSKSISQKLRSAIPKKWNYDAIEEPVGKNTAPAVAIAAAWIQAKYGDSVMVVLSADHNIQPKEEFTKAVNYAVELADSKDQLVVFGIKPARPETGYGYIQLGKDVGNSDGVHGYKVKRFVEKPSADKAQMYVKSGTYMWNSGMFIWKTSTILEEFEAYMPDLYKLVEDVTKKKFTQKAIDTFYNDCSKESIDFGIMEHSKRVSAVVGKFDWDDIGSWEYVSRFYGQNDKSTTVVGKNIYEKECNGSIVVNHSKLTVATIGLENMVVVATDDAIMVVARDRLPDLKKYMAEMKKNPKLPKTLF